MRFWDTILSIIFPERCLGCGRPDAAFCRGCLAECPAAERESARWIFPVYDYRHPLIKKSLWLFKYKSRRVLARIFAEIIYEKMEEELSELRLMENFRDPLLIPVPLSRKRLRERGYNQAELLCEEIIKLANMRDGVNMHLEKNILVKPKDTEHQARIRDRRKRLQNMRGTFVASPGELLKGQNIILIDDIVTTGATLSAARRVLYDAGARKVIAFTVAH